MKRFFMILGMIGFVFILGTAGASDTNTISSDGFAVQSVLSCGMVFVSLIGFRLEVMKERHIRARRMITLHHTQCRKSINEHMSCAG